ncbi:MULTISPECIES: SRPBCC domain-containing protein [Actinomadura]|uniref:SRPBCC domain-containing protein n=1 Tax=Actinomadura yumaensis TaxID=111807 RepID=A0ABW2CJV0_9ACTN|nr:SRPBCC domain-containing protein [Actinomadura sp. J1-007]MWK40104.1 polyketide cyclase [Actinomadura sp. J1-007]
MSVAHATFTLERFYRTPVARVFAAWADPAAKARWCGTGGGERRFDFRVGGVEVGRVNREDGTPLIFESRYQDIVENERILYSTTLSEGDALATVSLTTVEFLGADDGARLVLTEQGTYLEGREEPAWRERGTADWLDALSAELHKDDR